LPAQGDITVAEIMNNRQSGDGVEVGCRSDLERITGTRAMTNRMPMACKKKGTFGTVRIPSRTLVQKIQDPPSPKQPKFRIQGHQIVGEQGRGKA
jgi:hypothetical protein